MFLLPTINKSILRSNLKVGTNLNRILNIRNLQNHRQNEQGKEIKDSSTLWLFHSLANTKQASLTKSVCVVDAGVSYRLL